MHVPSSRPTFHSKEKLPNERKHFYIEDRNVRKVAGFWDERKNQRDFMDKIANQLGFKRMNDWYNFTLKQMLEKGGRSLVGKYDNSPAKTIISIYGEHSWQVSNFLNIGLPKGYWDDMNNCKSFLNRLGNHLGFKEIKDWYTITAKQINENGGISLLTKYGGSPSKMIRSVYFENSWDESKFNLKPLPIEYWDIENHRVELIKSLEKGLYILELEDWYRVSLNQIRTVCGTVSVFKRHSLDKLLGTVYSNHEWDRSRLQFRRGSRKASQRWLKAMVKQIFSTSELYESYRHEGLRNQSGYSMELDIYLPNEQLAFEYQGEHHYFDVYGMGSHWERRERDKEKQEACQKKQITLIEIPYWWDFTLQSLMATIHKHRPDLIDTIEECGTSLLMHGQEWDGIQDLKGWWMSEKYDGMRAYWDGLKMFSRNFKQIVCPLWFTEQLPKDTSLDGELWLGRGKFEILNTLLISKEDISKWQDVKYMVFDLPASKEPFEQRMRILANIKLPNHVQLVAHKECEGNEHLNQSLAEIIALGGEGLMVNKPSSIYIPNRCDDLQKVKVNSNVFLFRQLLFEFYRDCEVQLLEVLPTGLFCLQLSGTASLIACNSEIIQSPPPIGSLLTIKHSDFYKNGTLRHPFFWRVRVAKEHHSSLWEPAWDSSDHFLTSKANWIEWGNRRDFFDLLGKEMGFKSTTEFRFIAGPFVKQHGGKALLDYYYHGSMLEGLQDVYCQHDWSAWKLNNYNAPSRYWTNKENERNFLKELGHELGFQHPDDWQNITFQQIKDYGGLGLLRKYQNSVPRLVKSVLSETMSSSK